MGLPGSEFIGDPEVRVMGGEVFNLPVSIAIDPYQLEKSVTEFSFKIQSLDVDDTVVEQSTKFLYR